jgi:hypothetical protein
MILCSAGAGGLQWRFSIVAQSRWTPHRLFQLDSTKPDLVPDEIGPIDPRPIERTHPSFC